MAGMVNLARGRFASRLAELLTASPLRTRSELAAAIGVAPNTVTNWMRGASPSVEHIRRLCRLFGVSADYLLGLDSDTGPPMPYHEALTDAALSLSGGTAWSVIREWQAYEGDERPLTELRPTPDTPIGAALYAALSMHPTSSALHPWEIVREDHIRELERLLESDASVTIGEARLLADGLHFHGGARSPKRNEAFYRDILAQVRTRMADTHQ